MGAIVLLLAVLSPAIAGQFEDGVKAYQARDYPAAIQSLRAFLAASESNDPRRREANSYIGLSHYFRNEFREAAAALDAADLSIADTAYALGLSQLKLNNAAGARRAFAALFGVAPDSPRASLLTASIMMRNRMEEQARAELQRVPAATAPPETHYLLGELAIQRGDYQAAIADLRRELDSNPAFSLAWYRLGDAYTRLSKWNDAESALKKALWLNPDFSSPYVLLGKVYSHLDRPDLASGVLEKALSMDPNNAGARYQLAQIYQRLGRMSEAQKQMDLYRGLAPGPAPR